MTARRVAVALVAALQAFLSLWRLGTSTWHVDEILYARAGRAYVDGDLTANLEHPPLAKYLIGLPQALFHESTSTARLAPVLAGAAIGLALFLLVRGTMGFWAGLAVWAAWVLLPRSAGLMEAGTHLTMVRLERFALLDVIATGFAVAALALGWRWAHARGWWPAVGTGALIGLAVASKLPGVLVAPVVAGAVLWRRRDRRALAELAVAAGTSVAAFGLAYAPFGSDAPEAVRFMVDYQLDHAAEGHRIFTGGEMRTEAPWWVFGSYQIEADGWVLTAAVVAAMAAAVVLGRRRPVVWYLLAATLVPLVVLSLSPVVLRHYRYLVLPGQVALVALGLVLLVRRPSVLARGLALALALPLALAAGRDVARIATLAPTDYARLGEVLEEAGQEGGPAPVVVLRGSAQLAVEYAPAGTTFTSSLPADGGDPAAPGGGGPVAVVLDPTAMLLRPDAQLEAAVADLGFVEASFGRLEVHLRPDVADAAGVQPGR